MQRGAVPPPAGPRDAVSATRDNNPMIREAPAHPAGPRTPATCGNNLMQRGAVPPPAGPRDAVSATRDNNPMNREALAPPARPGDADNAIRGNDPSNRLPPGDDPVVTTDRAHGSDSETAQRPTQTANGSSATTRRRTRACATRNVPLSNPMNRETRPQCSG